MNLSAVLLDSPLAPPEGRRTLQYQLLQRLKQSILDGRLHAGSRLPATRTLAEQMGLSRNTVTLVYAQLAAEGYVRADRQGTRVAPLPSAMVARPIGSQQAGLPPARRVASISPAGSHADAGAPLRPGTPALSRFPLGTWRRAIDRSLRMSPVNTLAYGDPAGELALRRAIAQHLGVSRGVRCEPAQVVITEGTQEALGLCVRLFSNPGDTAWIENPGYRGAKAAFQAGDLRIVPVPVDNQGLAIPEGWWRTRPPRLVYTTPSHQYPTGAVLAAARRLELLEHARGTGAWIIEDDYDSEFRHHGNPIPAMQGLADDPPVLYAGSFSKTMFPALRTGFLVLPPAQAAQLAPALSELLRGGHRHEQLALAAFIDSGQFARHLGRMRRLYRDRQLALRAALQRYFDFEHEVLGGHGGLHLAVRLPSQMDDRAITAAARRAGLAPVALSAFALCPAASDNGLVLGYGNTSAELFDPLIRRLAGIIADMPDS